MGYCEAESLQHAGLGVCTTSVKRPVDPKLAAHERVLEIVYEEGTRSDGESFNPQWETDLDPSATCISYPCDATTCGQTGTCEVNGAPVDATMQEWCGQC